MSATLDLTPIVVAVVGGVLAIIGAIATALINERAKNNTDAATLGTAVKNSLGALEQAADGVIVAAHPTVALPPGVPASLAVPVQYVLDHAGPEAARFGITPELIADKVNAQIGLTNAATKLATALASPPALIPHLGMIS